MTDTLSPFLNSDADIDIEIAPLPNEAAPDEEREVEADHVPAAPPHMEWPVGASEDWDELAQAMNSGVLPEHLADPGSQDELSAEDVLTMMSRISEDPRGDAAEAEHAAAEEAKAVGEQLQRHELVAEPSPITVMTAAMEKPVDDQPPSRASTAQRDLETPETEAPLLNRTHERIIMGLVRELIEFVDHQTRIGEPVGRPGTKISVANRFAGWKREQGQTIPVPHQYVRRLVEHLIAEGWFVEVEEGRKSKRRTHIVVNQEKVRGRLRMQGI